MKNSFFRFFIFLTIFSIYSYADYTNYEDPKMRNEFSKEAKKIVYDPLIKTIAYNAKIVNFKKLTSNDKPFSQFFNFSTIGDNVPYLVEIELAYKRSYGNSIENFFDKYAIKKYTNGDRAEKFGVDMYYTNRENNKVLFKSYQLKGDHFSEIRRIANSYKKNRLNLYVDLFLGSHDVEKRWINRKHDFSSVYYNLRDNTIDESTKLDDISNNLEEIILPYIKLGMNKTEFIANNKRLYFPVLITKEQSQKLRTLKLELIWR
jgi:hypothetical protein